MLHYCHLGDSSTVYFHSSVMLFLTIHFDILSHFIFIIKNRIVLTESNCGLNCVKAGFVILGCSYNELVWVYCSSGYCSMVGFTCTLGIKQQLLFFCKKKSMLLFPPSFHSNVWLAAFEISLKQTKTLYPRNHWNLYGTCQINRLRFEEQLPSSIDLSSVSV